MTTVPLHPALVHVPLGLAFVLPVVTAGIALAVWRRLVPRRTWIIAIALQATLVVTGAAALRTGERDEKRVERITGERAIESHEEAAKAFLSGAAGVLAVSISLLALPARAVPALGALVVVGTFVVAGLGYRTGRAGGDLVYARGGAAAFAAEPSLVRATELTLMSRSSHRKKHHD